MSLFDDDSKDNAPEIRAVSGTKDKLPKTPNLKEWGAPIRKSSPFLLDDFSSGAPANTSKP